jgi:hypothetical protein
MEFTTRLVLHSQGTRLWGEPHPGTAAVLRAWHPLRAMALLWHDMYNKLKQREPYHRSNVAIFVAGRSWPHTSSQVFAANPWTQASSVHTLGTSKYPGGPVTQVSIHPECTSCVWPHASQSYQHFIRKYIADPTTILSHISFVICTLRQV